MKVSVLAAGLLFVIQPSFSGDVTGRALITKRLSKKSLPPGIYDLRGTAAPVLSGDTDPVNEFDRMVVILEGGKMAPKPAENLVLEQRNGRFDPDLVVIPTGSTIQFPNADPIFHNVFSLSRAHSFDLGFYPKGQSRSMKFTREGIVQVYCHIHANMYAAIVVTSSPWYAKPSADGSFSWDNVPAGHYRVVAWHKVAGTFRTEIDVPENGKTEFAIRVPIDTESKP
jgi:plastocyanin